MENLHVPIWKSKSTYDDIFTNTKTNTRIFYTHVRGGLAGIVAIQ